MIAGVVAYLSKLGIGSWTPPWSADWWATMPGATMARASYTSTAGSRFSNSAMTNSLASGPCEPPWPPAGTLLGSGTLLATCAVGCFSQIQLPLSPLAEAPHQNTLIRHIVSSLVRNRADSLTNGLLSHAFFSHSPAFVVVHDRTVVAHASNGREALRCDWHAGEFRQVTAVDFAATAAK